jgi:hypothetical protein
VRLTININIADIVLEMALSNNNIAETTRNMDTNDQVTSWPMKTRLSAYPGVFIPPLLRKGPTAMKSWTALHRMMPPRPTSAYRHKKQLLHEAGIRSFERHRLATNT